MKSSLTVTWLLAWNPGFYSESEVSESIAPLKKGKPVIFNWNCGRTKAIAKGDRAFMIRLGKEPRGIVGAGLVVHEREEDAHFSGDGMTGYVDVKWEHFSLVPVVPMSILQRPPFRGFKWSTQSSGIRVRPELVPELEKTWRIAVRGFGKVVDAPGVADVRISEGAMRRSVMTRYERDPRARAACLAKYGTACVICGFDFHKAYGEAGEGLAVVHHLLPLSEAKASRTTRPLRDLRPVCANCHLVIHRHSPSLSIKDLKNAMVGKPLRSPETPPL